MIGTKSRAEDSYSVLSSAAPESPALFSSSLSTRWHQCLEEKKALQQRSRADMARSQQ